MKTLKRLLVFPDSTINLLIICRLTKLSPPRRTSLLRCPITWVYLKSSSWPRFTRPRSRGKLKSKSRRLSTRMPVMRLRKSKKLLHHLLNPPPPCPISLSLVLTKVPRPSTAPSLPRKPPICSVEQTSCKRTSVSPR